MLQVKARPIRHEAAPHLFTTGQIVRLKDGFRLQSQSVATYRITAALPPRGDSLQYRIRSDDELYERVATQDSLERYAYRLRAVAVLLSKRPPAK